MAKMVKYVNHPIGFYRAFRSWNGPVGQSMRADTELTATAARLTAPVDTGELKAGHVTRYGHAGKNRDLESQVIALPEHAIYVIKGTEPHVIRAKRAPRLVFFWRKVGRVVAFKSVNHPGTSANNYLLAALKRVVGRRT
jgi:hypothetical protein